MKKMKVISFEMDDEDFDTLITILHGYVVKHKYEFPLECSEDVAKWHKKHGDYVQKDILDKVIKGIQK